MSAPTEEKKQKTVFEAYAAGETVFTADGQEWAIVRIKDGKAKLRAVFFRGEVGRIGQATIPVEHLRTKV